MNRKEFILTSSLAAGAFATSSFSISDKAKKLVILHTNDQHSRIEPFEATHPKLANQGGFARRATLIEQIRSKEEAVLLLDSGDIFQGTPYFNFFGGELEFKLMSLMGYDASTMGNHDFDNGLEGFLKVLPHAKFPFICSNYDFKNTILEGKTVPYKVIRKNGIKIGLIGLGIAFDGLVPKKCYKETKYLNPVEMANHYATFLKKEKKVDVVICLSHLGLHYKEDPQKISDTTLAPQSEQIDIILGGHTHSFMEKPLFLKNKTGKDVLIHQVGWGGVILGRIDVFFEKVKGEAKISYQHDQLPIHSTTEILG